MKQPETDNPKDIIGRTKPPLELIPPSALVHEAMAMKIGAVKYTPYNWRDKKVSAMCYLGACLRHVLSLIDGEDYAPDSGVHHAAHARACMGIFLDAMETKNLVDDRPPKGKCAEILTRYTECRECAKTGAPCPSCDISSRIKCQIAGCMCEATHIVLVEGKDRQYCDTHTAIAQNERRSSAVQTTEAPRPVKDLPRPVKDLCALCYGSHWHQQISQNGETKLIPCPSCTAAKKDDCPF